MNAPNNVIAFATAPAQSVAPDLSRLLFDAAQLGWVALSDGRGCRDFLQEHGLGSGFGDREAARRVAIDLAQHAARRLNAVLDADAETTLAAACRKALARAEKVAAGELDPYAALAEVSDLIAAALVASGEVRP